MAKNHEKIKVLIADDHALLREGLRKILELEDDIEVVGEAVDGQEAVEKAEQLLPDVVLMDINMPRGGGLGATRAIKQRFPDIDVIGLTIHDAEEYVVELVNAGAKGYMLKDVEPARVVEAIRRVRDGEAFIPPDLMARVFRQFGKATMNQRDTMDFADEKRTQTNDADSQQGNSRQTPGESQAGEAPGQYAFTPKPPPVLREPLTEREQEILQLIVDGNTNKEIGQKLFISEKTVKNHVTQILSKLQLSDRTQAAVFAIRHSMVRVS